jgi:hypothetical protein
MGVIMGDGIMVVTGRIRRCDRSSSGGDAMIVGDITA